MTDKTAPDVEPTDLKSALIELRHAREEITRLRPFVDMVDQAQRAADAAAPSAPVARAAVLTDEAALIELHCPDHGPQDQDGVWMDCHCPVAEDMRKRAAVLRRLAGEAQQPETQAAADCPYGEGPGDGSGCIKPAGHDGDHVVTPGVTVVPCSRAVVHQQHIPHVWWPQPGMAYVHCPGHSVDTAAVSQPTVAQQADTAGEQQ
jgi:hypothetical protein